MDPKIQEVIKLAMAGDTIGAAEVLKSLISIKKESYLTKAKDFITSSILECSCGGEKAPSDLEATGTPSKEDDNFKQD